MLLGMTPTDWRYKLLTPPTNQQENSRQREKKKKIPPTNIRASKRPPHIWVLSIFIKRQQYCVE